MDNGQQSYPNIEFVLLELYFTFQKTSHAVQHINANYLLAILKNFYHAI